MSCKKCPKCELNYIQDSEEFCSFCKPDNLNNSIGKSKTNSTINESMISSCYEYGKRYAFGEISITEAVAKVVSLTKMNASSAQASIVNVKYLFEGKRYTRTMSEFQTKWMLEKIKEEYGCEAFYIALTSVEKHLDYYESLPNGGRNKELSEYICINKRK